MHNIFLLTFSLSACFFSFQDEYVPVIPKQSSPTTGEDPKLSITGPSPVERNETVVEDSYESSPEIPPSQKRLPTKAELKKPPPKEKESTVEDLVIEETEAKAAAAQQEIEKGEDVKVNKRYNTFYLFLTVLYVKFHVNRI